MQPQTTARASRPRKSREVTQSLHAVQIADALLKITTVMAVAGLSESSIRRKVIPIKRVYKTLFALVPGTAANIAKRKRKMEKRLHERGYSLTHARSIVAKYFAAK